MTIKPAIFISCLIALATACSGGDDQSAQEETSSTTVEAPGCLSPEEVNELVWDGQLKNGAHRYDEESAGANALPDEAIGDDAIHCAYSFDYSGDPVKLEYRTARYDDINAEFTELYERYIDLDYNVWHLGYKDTSSFVLYDDSEIVYRYTDGDERACFGRVSEVTYMSEETRDIYDLAADRLATKAACDIDVRSEDFGATGGGDASNEGGM